jgi:pimeloyl-ACP methyl ester carboxylesterase
MARKKKSTHPAPAERAADTFPGGRPAIAASVAAGAALAGWALLTHRAARRAEAAHPPTGRFVEADGVRLHYIEAGHGSPVVLLHGNGASAADFAASGLLSRLAESHRVIAFDRPGYGWSERPRSRIWSADRQARLVADALDALGVERAIVLGHSWGTLVALALALRAPERVRGLALLSGPYFPEPRLDVWMFSPPALPVIGDVLRYTGSPLVSRAIMPALFARIFAPKPVSRRFRERFSVGMAVRPSQLRASAAESALMMTGAARMASRYRDLAMPVAILTGAEDQMVPAAQAARLHEAVAGSTLRLFPGVGHMMHYAVPRAVADEVAKLDRSAGRA